MLFTNRGVRSDSPSTELGPDEVIVSPEDYPDVPPPESDTSIRLIAARWICGQIHGEDMPTLAADLLEEGLDTPAIRRLAAETEASCNADVEDLMVRLFRESGITYPLELRVAKLYLSRHFAREIISGRRELWRAASDFKRLWDWTSDSDDIAEALGLLTECIFDYDLQRFRLAVTKDLIDTFARIAKLADSDISG